ncbi:hypothetical protein [Rathayibacter sp. AY1A2]|uniref:hypothetical protein n=1 Tax=Rathayibacter sp. AY1A2 TaxID=2080520 RepID=UPI0011AFFA27|nr:hypothetical protein [Rathayibacter sp. AY1A2]
MTDAPITVNTPDGPGTKLEWPSEPGGPFRKVRGSGEGLRAESIPVVPVELASGEVKLYRKDKI